MSESTCKHCTRLLKGEPNKWVHAEGGQRGRMRCHAEPYGFNAEALGEDCSIACLGHSGPLEVSKGIFAPNEPFFIYPVEA